MTILSVSSALPRSFAQRLRQQQCSHFLRSFSTSLSKTHFTRPHFFPSVLRWSACVASSLPMLTATLLASLLSVKTGEVWLSRWAGVQRSIFGMTMHIDDRNVSRGGYESPRGFVFVLLNQSSLSEMFLHTSMLPALPKPSFVFANIEYLLIPLFGWTVAALGAVPVVRQWSSQARRALDRAAQKIRDGHSCYISIEGQRSRSGDLGVFKRGAAVLAIQAQADIVPVMFLGARDRLPYGERRFRPGHVIVIFGERVPTEGMTFDDRFELTERLRQCAEQELGQGLAASMSQTSS
eukprot:TRINITY_DN10163_c0_g1_i1.p1 TRINITY_DN10163_c0_g1~~TRINITY_DN10163_c0_g1_i1.p1  ORF type:complete len:303 (+),score=4.96 TRINITY_DN10163_c0_g1_i1:28-909(+)